MGYVGTSDVSRRVQQQLGELSQKLHSLQVVVREKTTNAGALQTSGFASAGNLLNPYDLVNASGKLVLELWRTPSTIGSGTVLQNGWVDYGSGYTPLSFRRDRQGRVHLRGVIKSGTFTNGVVLFTLPLGYRPVYKVQLVAASWNNTALVPCLIDINTNGVVTILQANGNTSISIYGSFDLD